MLLGERRRRPSHRTVREPLSEQHSTRRRRVIVRVGPLDHGFYVEDDGPGIPVDIKDDVFDHGFTTAEDGSGYGLSIVRTIAGAHGWDILVTDSDTGGARFEITGVEFLD